MMNQATPRGHHPGPRRGEVLDTEPKLGAPCGFQCQDKTQWETKVLTSVLVREGSLGPCLSESLRFLMTSFGEQSRLKRGTVLFRGSNAVLYLIGSSLLLMTYVIAIERSLHHAPCSHCSNLGLLTLCKDVCAALGGISGGLSMGS
jgi:hypothetical protein